MVILITLSFIVVLTGQWQPLNTVGAKSLIFIMFSGLATGASWLCCFRALKIGDASRVAPLDKLSVVLVALFGVAFLGERLAAVHWPGVAMIGGGVILLSLK